MRIGAPKAQLIGKVSSASTRDGFQRHVLAKEERASIGEWSSTGTGLMTLTGGTHGATHPTSPESPSEVTLTHLMSCLNKASGEKQQGASRKAVPEPHVATQ